MSGFSSLCPEAVPWAEGVAVEEEADGPEDKELDSGFAETLAERAADMDAFPLIWDDAAAGTVPNDFTTLSFMGFGAAGDDEIGADASSMDPKVTGEPGKWGQRG
jgi:hypothetical protein